MNSANFPLKVLVGGLLLAAATAVSVLTSGCSKAVHAHPGSESRIDMAATNDAAPVRIGVWLQVAGTSKTRDASTMNVDLSLSSTPQVGRFWQGYRSRWVDPILPDLCPGDVLMLHMSYGHIPGRAYTLQDFDNAGKLCPMLVDWADYRFAWTTLRGGVEFVPYLGSPVLAGKGSKGAAIVNQYLAPYDRLSLRVAFDACADLGGPDPDVKAAVMDYRRKHGILVEPWISEKELPDADGVGVVCTTAEYAKWQAQQGGQPAWFPPKADLKRPVWFLINDLPGNWSQMADADRINWMARRAIAIAKDGDVPFVPMSAAGCIKQFNEYFKRKQ